MVKKDKDYFDYANIQKDLKAKSIKGGVFTLLGEAIRFVLNVGGTMILARMLTPEDYGIVGMVAVIINFASLFKDLGLSTATIQKEIITHDQVSTLFWINILFSIIIILFLTAISPLVAMLYRKKELVYVCISLAIPILFNGIALQFMALLKRQLKFGTIALLRNISFFLSLVIAIICAYFKLNYWAIIIKEISFAFFLMTGVMVCCGWVPSLPVRKSGVKSMVYFGKDVSLSTMAIFLKENLDYLIVGKLFGEKILGLYTKSFQLLMLPVTQLKTPLQSIMLPVLSSLQSNPDKYKKYLTQYFEILSILFMPLMVFLSVFAEECILLFLGEQWIESAWMFRIFSIIGVAYPLNASTPLILKSTGQARRNLNWTIINSVMTVGSFSFGAIWGIRGLLIATVTIFYVLLIPTFVYCTKNTPVSAVILFKAIISPLFISLSTGIVLYIQKHYLGNNGLVSGIVIALLVYSAIWFAVPFFRKKMIMNINLLKSIIK